LALTLPGATADLLQDQGHCFSVDPADRRGLAEAILTLHRSWRDRYEAVPAKNLDCYERKNLTREFSILLSSATGISA